MSYIFYTKWHRITLRSSKADWSRSLYAYLHPDTDKILYLGKADKYSIRQRLDGCHKDDIWNYLSEEFAIDRYGLIAGEVLFENSGRFSSQMLSDIESLLISRIKPPANIQCIKNRISRPDMIVICEGDWPYSKRKFMDR